MLSFNAYWFVLLNATLSRYVDISSKSTSTVQTSAAVSMLERWKTLIWTSRGVWWFEMFELLLLLLLLPWKHTFVFCFFLMWQTHASTFCTLCRSEGPSTNKPRWNIFCSFFRPMDSFRFTASCWRSTQSQSHYDMSGELYKHQQEE